MTVPVLPQHGMITPPCSEKEEDQQPERQIIKHVHGMKNVDPLSAISHASAVGSGVVVPSVPKFVSFQAQRQWQLEHMAGVFRHWAHENYVFGMSGHISVRDPEYTNAFWTNPLGKGKLCG